MGQREGVSRPGYVGRGGYWQWCRSCRSYAHYSSLIPEWWECDLEIDPLQLMHDPGTIDAALDKQKNLKCEG
jgi:hypothetical protein